MIRFDEMLWKNLCLRWWNELQNKSKVPFSLEIVFENVGKDWFWFASCFANHDFDGLSWKLDEQDWLCFGEMKKNELNGFGIGVELYKDAGLFVGHFINGTLCGEGAATFTNGDRVKGYFKEGWLHGYARYVYYNKDIYEGDWQHGKKHGKGKYLWRSGIIFEGEYEEGIEHGMGSVTLPDGFHFECKWEESIPVDESVCIHPSIRYCLDSKICTGVVTGTSHSFPQFLHHCEDCDKFYCPSCYKSCHNQHNWTEHWSMYPYCQCEDEKNCVNRGEAPPFKKQKIQY